jgi:excisionase family DNA binding protein
MSDHLINRAELCARLGISQSTSYNLTAKGLLPAPLKVGRSSRWRVRDVEAAIGGGRAQQVAA